MNKNTFKYALRHSKHIHIENDRDNGFQAECPEMLIDWMANNKDCQIQEVGKTVYLSNGFAGEYAENFAITFQ